MPERKKCFGTIFPDLDQLQLNAPLKGKVFSVLARSSGIGIQNREIQADPQAWDACRQCPEYSSCYDFSMARISLDQALRQRT